MRRDVFQAIADPTRREIINAIAKQPLNFHTIAETCGMSRQAVTKHIKTLNECGLIVIKEHGRERYCEARLKELSKVSDWIEQYRELWNKKLDSLEGYLKTLQKKKKTNGKKA